MIVLDVRRCITDREPWATCAHCLQRVREGGTMFSDLGQICLPCARETKQDEVADERRNQEER